MLTINRERSERRKFWENWRFGHKKIIGPRSLGGAPPPPSDPLVGIHTRIFKYGKAITKSNEVFKNIIMTVFINNAFDVHSRGNTY